MNPPDRAGQPQGLCRRIRPDSRRRCGASKPGKTLNVPHRRSATLSWKLVPGAVGDRGVSRPAVLVQTKNRGGSGRSPQWPRSPARPRPRVAFEGAIGRRRIGGTKLNTPGGAFPRGALALLAVSTRQGEEARLDRHRHPGHQHQLVPAQAAFGSHLEERLAGPVPADLKARDQAIVQP